MILTRLVLYCRTNVKIAESAALIRSILKRCNDYSPASGLTGGFAFNEQFVLMVVEGARVQVSKELKLIYDDSRLAEVTVLTVEEIHRRVFDGWTIGYAGHTIDTERLFLRYSPVADLNPTMMSGAAAFEFLRDFCALDAVYVQRSRLGEARVPPSPKPPIPDPETETIKVVNTRASH